MKLAWTRASAQQDPDSNRPLLSKPLIPPYLSHQSCLDLTLTGAPDKTHYSLNYALYLFPSPPLLFIYSLGIFFSHSLV